MKLVIFKIKLKLKLKTYFSFKMKIVKIAEGLICFFKTSREKLKPSVQNCYSRESSNNQALLCYRYVNEKTRR